MVNHTAHTRQGVVEPGKITVLMCHRFTLEAYRTPPAELAGTVSVVLLKGTSSF